MSFPSTYPIVRLPNGVEARNAPAPADFEFCAICRAYHAPEWHQPEWRRERVAASNYEAVAIYALPTTGARGH